MTNDTYSFFASYLPEDGPTVLPILETLEEKGYRVTKHLDTKAFCDLPTFIRINIAECDFFLVLLSDKYPQQASYSQEPLIAYHMKKPVLAILLDASDDAATLARISEASLLYDYSQTPNVFKAVDAILSASVCRNPAEADEFADTTEYFAHKHLLHGIELYERHRYDMAFIVFSKAAENGNKQALFHLGKCYLHGHGVDKSDEQALFYFSKGAEGGNTEAQYYAALLLLNGRGATKNEAAAARYLQQASDNNHAGSQTLLGGLYYYGMGVPMDKAAAIALFEKAAAQNYQEAIDLLEKIKNESGSDSE